MSWVPVQAVEVTAWGERVGAVALDPSLGAYVFEYYPDWVARGVELAPLTMPVRRRRHVFPQLPEATFHRLPAVLADALPDDFGNAVIDAWLARQGVGRGAVTPLDRLAYMADRAMGALEFRPSRGPRHRTTSAVELSDLVAGARSVLDAEFTSDRETESAIRSLIQVGTSAGGARAKAVIAWDRATGEVRSGQLPAPEGFEHWLLKLDGMGGGSELGQGDSSGRVELAYSAMAGAAGVDMTECRLLEEGDRAHFMTRRFDRLESGKAHSVTLCGTAHLDYRQRQVHDYGQLFDVVSRVAGREALPQAFRRMVFNVLAANNDDHTKNTSFLLRSPGSAWELAPAYDVTFAHNPTGRFTDQHLMGVDGVWRDPGRDDVMRLADRHLVPGASDIVAEVHDAVAGWRGFADEAGVPDRVVRHVEESLLPW
ncbi:HipA domain-containing protein [Frigoribacterium faeni]|uniref:HipA domain-containing protein n=1 Tax=Frigoribacterium faeni TaxID=145483 RepID=UPI00141AFCD9|nr:serine/threonine-protein kinase HipA [Frigoribacterium faeni]